MKYFRTILLCLTGLATTAAAESAPEGSLAYYLRLAAEGNPGLHAASREHEAALARARGADSLPDPQLTLGYFVEEVETRVGPQEQRIGVSQMIPWTGKLNLREKAAGAGAEAAEARVHARELALFFDVKEAFFENWYLAQALQITEENIELVKHLEQVAQARVRGGGAVSGAIKAQVELGKLDDRRRTLDAMRNPLDARLNAAIGRPADTPLPTPRDPVFHDPVALSRDALTSALRTNPMLAMIDAMIRKREFQADLARKDRYPDFMVGVDYINTGDALNPNMVDSGKDPLIAMVGITLPIWPEKNRARIDEARALRHAAEQELSDETNLLESKLSQALFRYDDAARKLALYRETLVPQAHQSLKVAEDAYASGAADFLNLIDAERLLLEFQLGVERARADLEIGMARIEMLTGRQWTTENTP